MLNSSFVAATQQFWARLIDFGDGPEAVRTGLAVWRRQEAFFTPCPAHTASPRPSPFPQNNILIANIENSDRLAFHVLNGGERVATLEIDDFWAPAREEMVHVCFTLGENGRAEAYVNGESKGSSLDNGLPDILTRANMFVGKSNWPDEGEAGWGGDGLWEVARLFFSFALRLIFSLS